MSASFRLQDPDAKLIIQRLDMPEELDGIVHHVETALQMFRHAIYGETGPVVDVKLRDSFYVEPDYRPQLLKVLDLEADKYYRTHFDAPPDTHLVPSLNGYFLYMPGNGMCLHADDHKITTRGLQYSDSQQILSMILYCNNNFTGGDIEFPEQSLRISPRAGMLVMFPSNKNFPHMVYPIIDGMRISYQRFYSLGEDK